MRFINIYDYPNTLDQMAESIRFMMNSLNDGDHEPTFRYYELKDGISAPITGSFASIYIDSADGDLKIRFSDGVTKTISADT